MGVKAAPGHLSVLLFKAVRGAITRGPPPDPIYRLTRCHGWAMTGPRLASSVAAPAFACPSSMIESKCLNHKENEQVNVARVAFASDV